MKVLQILPELNSGGVERGTIEVAGYLVEAGHEAVVVSNGGRLVAELERAGGRHIEMPVHAKRLGSLRQMERFRRLLEVERPDVLHIRSRVPGWIAYLAWRKMERGARPRLVSTVHGFYSVNAYSAVMTRGERVIAVSESVREYVFANYKRVPREKVKVIHRGVDSGLYYPGFEPSDEWTKEWERSMPQLGGKVLVTLPGRITRWKGQMDFVHVMALLKAKGCEVHGIIVGETHPGKVHYRDEVIGMIEKERLADDISILNHRSDLKEIMAVSAVVMSLSREPEAFGRVSLEALMLGRPVVAYDHGGVSEQLRLLQPDGLIPVGDVRAAAEKVLQYVENVPAVVRDGTFELQTMLEATVKVYEEVISLS